MASIRNLKDPSGSVFYPLTHERAVKGSNGVSLESKLAGLESKSYVEAWDGASTPVVANIPAGVTVTYNTTTYTGTLAASADTIGKIYLVKNGNDYDRYITSQSGSSYSWVANGTTAMDLSGYATDAELGQLEAKVNNTPSDAVKDALLLLASKVAYIDEHGQDYYDTLYDALYPSAELVGITAVYTQSGAVYDVDELSVLKADLVVTAVYSDSSTRVIAPMNCILSGSLSPGNSTITVAYGVETDTFNVVVTDYRTVMSYVYSDGDLTKFMGTIHNDQNLGFGLVLSYPSTYINRRRVFVIERGEAALYKTDDTQGNISHYSLTDPPLFPIPVPPTATKVTVGITPNTQYFGITGLVLNNGVYSLTLDDGWKVGSREITFTAGTYTHIIINCKQNSSGTDYTVEPTELTITFE